MGWPEDTPDLERFYPTNVLVTGFDIITFWVSRMMMMGVHFTGAEPFRDVVIHGMVRDYEGKKMSKSAGNVLDPLELVDKYGADPVRLALLQSAAPGHDIPLDEQWIDATRRFGNKVWNALRFAVDHMEVTGVPVEGGYPEDPGPEDAWILHRLAAVTAEYDRLLDGYRFADAMALIYSFAWSEVFDWYLEMSKTPLQDEARVAVTKQTLGVVLRDLLKLFSPAIPYVTEELWSELGDGSLLMTSSWPQPVEMEAPLGVDTLQELVVAIRRFRADHQLSARDELTVLVRGGDELGEEWWAEQMLSLAGANVEIGEGPDDPAGHTRLAVGGVEAFIPLAGVVDVEAERPRLEKSIAAAEAERDRSAAKLANHQFRQRAPAEVVAKEEAKLAEHQATIDKLQTHLAELG
jgi:valyl-tRNA synthetase